MEHHYDVWRELQKQHPRKYARDLARMMKISEAELAWARVGHDAWRLNGGVRELLGALTKVGVTKSISRNAYAVHEQVGAYQNLQLGERAGLILNPRGVDMRLFTQHWASAFHIRESTRNAERQSIQFFDHQGDSLLKVYATEQTDYRAWGELLAQFISADNPPLALQPEDNDTPAAPQPDSAVVEQEWRAMRDVHQFFTLLSRHNLTRQQAFNLVPDDLACKVGNDALSTLLNRAKQEGNEIMIFTGNRGCVQIFTGRLQKLVPMEGWINLFNDDFTLHLRPDAIAESWVTRKPTADGHVTSLELFADDGTQILQLYGQRSEGEPEQACWRAQVEALLSEGLAA